MPSSNTLSQKYPRQSTCILSNICATRREVDSFMLQPLYVRKICPLDTLDRKMVSPRDGLQERRRKNSWHYQASNPVLPILSLTVLTRVHTNIIDNWKPVGFRRRWQSKRKSGQLSQYGGWLGCRLELRETLVHFVAGYGILFSKALRQALGLTQPSAKWILRASSRVVNQPRCETYRSPASHAEVMNEWSYASTPAYHSRVYIGTKHNNNLI